MIAQFFLVEVEANLEILAARRLRYKCKAQWHYFFHHLEINLSFLLWPKMP